MDSHVEAIQGHSHTHSHTHTQGPLLSDSLDNRVNTINNGLGRDEVASSVEFGITSMKDQIFPAILVNSCWCKPAETTVSMAARPLSPMPPVCTARRPREHALESQLDPTIII